MKAPRESYPSSSSSSATTTATATATATLIYQYDYSLLAESVVTTATADYASSSSYNGFRRNPNKSSSSAAAITSITPITTYFWLLLNIGLYILYWNNRIEPSKVALNDKIIRTVYKKKGGFGFGGSSTSTSSDFSRGITGNLAHFEIWHIGMNMMTLLQVGEILENSKSVGTIPLFLWTCSFLGYTTICVIILYSIKEQIIRMRGRNNNSTTIATTRRKTRTKFPNMVGFSGILFCWSTYMTLSLDKNQKICPIPIVTQICFETYEFDFGLGKGFKFNWGPIVQLLMLQFILPRVSFIGHLSGIIIGFLWYWNILPSLELSQPSILFPLIWLLGKYYLYKMGCNNNNDDDDENDNDTERGQGHVLGGQGSNSNSGYVLGSSKNSSIINANSNNNNNNNNNDHPPQQGRLSSSSFLTLRFIRNCFILHLILITWVYTTRNQQQQQQQQVSLLRILVLLYYNNSIIISELLMIIILSLLVRATFTSQSLPNVNNNNVNNPFKSTGILGRGYIALCTVIFITDSMTLGGWFATRGLWSSSWTIPLFFIFIIRLILWIVSISTVCYILDCNNEIQDERRTHSSSDSNFAGIGDIDGDDNDDDDRIWFHIFGSFLINPCRTFGKVLTENRLSSSCPLSTAATAGGLAMTAAATTTSSTSRSGRSSDSISERRAKILSSRGGGGGNKYVSTITKVEAV